jgi:CheY-like chemotaxis protein
MVARRVLVVDDSDEILVLIQRVLSTGGYVVDVASTLAEARALDPREYDAVLIDEHLGSERGTDLVDGLRSADPGLASRCLVITGGSLDGLPSGVASLAKPFLAAELLEAVQALPSPALEVAATRQADVPRDLPVLRSATGPGRRPAPSGQLLAIFRRRRAHDWRELANFLHDGPIQELTAAVLDLHLVRGGEPPWPDSQVEAIRERIAGAASSLRWLVDGPWPWLPPESGVVNALERGTAGLLAAPATVRADARSVALDMAEVLEIADVVELLLIEMAPVDGSARADIAVRTEEHLIQTELSIAPAEDARVLGDAATARIAVAELSESLQLDAYSEFGDNRWFVGFGLPR